MSFSLIEAQRVDYRKSTITSKNPDNIPPAYGRQILPPVGQRWPTGGFWLYNWQFSNVGPTVAFHQWANSVFFQDGGEQ